jgi:DNA-binding FadR family transcriptional regulator
LLVQILQLVRDIMLKCMLRTTQGRGLKPEETRRLHQKIVDAIRSQDALRAEQAMREHMEAVQRRLRKGAAGDQAAGGR